MSENNCKGMCPPGDEKNGWCDACWGPESGKDKDVIEALGFDPVLSPPMPPGSPSPKEQLEERPPMPPPPVLAKKEKIPSSIPFPPAPLPQNRKAPIPMIEDFSPQEDASPLMDFLDGFKDEFKNKRFLGTVSDDVKAAGQGDRKSISKIIAACVTTALLATVAPAIANSGGPNCEQNVTVQKGDSLSHIGNQVGVSLENLLAYNDISNPDVIHPGDKICITPPYGFIHQDGETPYGVIVPTERERADHCAGGPQPGTIALRDASAEKWPEHGDHFVLGIYNCRAPRGGNGHSEHAEGRALDWKFFECSGDMESIADRLAENYAELGIQRIITCTREWIVGRGWFVPSQGVLDWHNGVKAPRHLHIEMTRQAAEALTLEAAKAAFVEPSPIPEEPPAIETIPETTVPTVPETVPETTVPAPAPTVPETPVPTVPEATQPAPEPTVPAPTPAPTVPSTQLPTPPVTEPEIKITPEDIERLVELERACSAIEQANDFDGYWTPEETERYNAKNCLQFA